MEIGKILKEAREAKGLTFEAVEEETKIRRRYIQALEQEQFKVLPGPIYAKAFLKNYAKFLGVNVEEIMEAYKLHHTEKAISEETVTPPVEKVRVKTQGRPRYWLYLVAAVIVIGLLASIVYGTKGMWLNPPADDGSDRLPAGEQTPPPAGEQPLPGEDGEDDEPAEIQGVKVVLNVKNSRSWIRVIVDGTPAFQGELAAGESKEFEGQEKIAFTLGNAGAVEVIVNGENMGFLDDPWQVVDREFSAPGR